MVRIHVVQVAYGDGEPVAERVDRVAALVRAQQGADLVVLPELWPQGGFSYRTWDDTAEELDGPTMTAMAAAARHLGCPVHAGSIVERAPAGATGAALGPQGRGRWNTSVVLAAGGGVLATYRKIHRFGFGEGEPAVMEAGEAVVTVPLPAGAHGSTVAGLATCYDLRFPEQFRLLLDAGAQLFLVPAAWPAARVGHWSLLGQARAIENQCVVVQCNTGGTHAGVAMGGRSQVVAATGEVLAEAGDGEEVLVVEVDLAEVDAYRERFPVLADRRL